MPYVLNPFTNNFDVAGAAGPAGPQGPAGPTGPQGPAGQGVPTGGTTGQVLTKTSSTNYDTYWATPSGGGGSVGIDPVIASMIF